MAQIGPKIKSAQNLLNYVTSDISIITLIDLFTERGMRSIGYLRNYKFEGFSTTLVIYTLREQGKNIFYFLRVLIL